MQAIDPAWFSPGMVQDAFSWLWGEGPNPFSCAALGEFVSIAATYAVSKASNPLPKAHIDSVFQDEAG
jgi:hypothetical protein